MKIEKCTQTPASPVLSKSDLINRINETCLISENIDNDKPCIRIFST